MAAPLNTSVMARCHDRRDPFNYFPTPPWATRALCERLVADGSLRSSQTCLEPACGEGHMARVIAEYGLDVIASDIQDMGAGGVGDFLFEPARDVDWIITNPPYRIAEDFIHKSLGEANVGVAMLTRLVFLESIGRFETLFTPCPPTYVMPFSERVVMLKGRLDPKASSATAYCWIVWLKDHKESMKLRLIGPCRQRLERPSDYEAVSKGDLALNSGLFAPSS